MASDLKTSINATTTTTNSSHASNANSMNNIKTVTETNAAQPNPASGYGYGGSNDNDKRAGNAGGTTSHSEKTAKELERGDFNAHGDSNALLTRDDYDETPN